MNTALTVEKETMSTVRHPKGSIVRHPNGFEGVLYGDTYLVVYYNNEQVLHTRYRNIDTEEELYALLEELPWFIREP